MPKPDNYVPTGQCCAADAPYKGPDGTFDQPFIYVFDGDQLDNNRDYHNLTVTTFSGADFLLRRIAGANRVAGIQQYRDQLARTLFMLDAKSSGGVSTNFYDFPIDPEWLYPAAADITFDLLNVLKTLKTDGKFTVPLSQIVFQGVRRFRGTKRPPSYRYWDDDWSYVRDISIDWLPADAPVRFEIPIRDFDFELLRITETIGEEGVPGFNTAVKIMLFDQMYEPVFSRPIIDDLIVDNSSDFNGITPVPGIVYRVGQSIRFDLYSLILPPSNPTPIQLRFHGVRRRPC